MDHTELATKMRLQVWLKDQKEYIASNMSIEEWCKYKNITRNTFFYRQRKLRQAAAESVTENEVAIHSLERFAQVPQELCGELREITRSFPTNQTAPDALPLIKLSFENASIDVYQGVSNNQLKMILGVLSNVK